MLAGSHRNAWPDETGTGGRTNRNTQEGPLKLKDTEHSLMRTILQNYASTP